MTSVAGHKKDGEKAVLLQSCGELLFGCTGRIRVTQGVYFARKGRKLECFCKRAVWVPDKFSPDHLKRMFAEFGADPSQCPATCHLIGLCGRNPTRTARATDSTFMIVAQANKKKFVIIAIAVVMSSQFDYLQRTSVTISSIATDPITISGTVAWIKNESVSHVKQITKKRSRRSKRHASSDDDDDADAESVLPPHPPPDDDYPLSPDLPLKVLRSDVAHDSPALVMTPLHSSSFGTGESAVPACNDVIPEFVRSSILRDNPQGFYSIDPSYRVISISSAAASDLFTITPEAVFQDYDPGMPVSPPSAYDIPSFTV